MLKRRLKFLQQPEDQTFYILLVFIYSSIEKAVRDEN